MSILLYDYKQLTECISEVERRDARVNSKNNGLMRRRTRKARKQKVPANLDSSSKKSAEYQDM
jgi:hypothetical protein